MEGVAFFGKRVAPKPLTRLSTRNGAPATPVNVLSGLGHDFDQGHCGFFCFQIFCYNACMINFAQELNTEQLRVVTHGDGACLVLAGAGSGKTRTITYRVAYLLEQGIRPAEILLVTFTNKAAREMLRRVAQLTNGQVHLPWSGTFHHIAFRLLKQFAPLLGYTSNFTILDADDSLELMKLCLKTEGIDRKEKRFPSPKVLQSIISFARNAERTIEDVLDEQHERFLPQRKTIQRIADDYAKRKREANVMDFDDLLVNLHLLLAKEVRVKHTLSEQFKYILVDEYQDTNRVQASIVDLLASVHKNILVVGDDAQSIYSFRAADIQNILQFEQRYPDANIYRLETNYRSTPEILALANDVIKQNLHQYEKALSAVNAPAAKPDVHAFADQTEEARFIADQIEELHAEGTPYSEIAVLFRAAFHSQALEMLLVKRGIPYEYRGGVRFFERSHIKDVLAFLRAYLSNTDTIAWHRILNLQVGIGPASASQVAEAIRTFSEWPPTIAEMQHIGFELPARAQRGWTDLLQIWEAMDASDKSPANLIEAIIDSKYSEYLESEYPNYRDRKDDIEQLAAFAEKAADLQTFLAEATLQESFRDAESALPEEKTEKVVLSTIHQAKGLEWEAVFVMHVAAGQFPHDRALTSRSGLEEERRLFYVAVTRAKKHLQLSYPLTIGRSMALGAASPFLEELDRALVEMHHLLEGSSVFVDPYARSGRSTFTDPSDDIDDVVYVPEDEPFESRQRSRPIGGLLKNIDEL